MRAVFFILFFVLPILGKCQNYVWHKTVGSSDYDQGINLQIDEFGSQFIVGTYRGTVDFDPNVGVFNIASNNVDEVFIQKLDSSGALIWAKSLQSDTIGPNMGYSNPTSICLDQNGNIIITGSFGRTVDFDPGPGVFNMTALNSGTGSRDMFILKLDSLGNFLWAKRIGNSGILEGITEVSVDLADNIYVCGAFNQTVDFDPGPGIFNLTGGEIFLLKLDSGGNFIWAFSEGGSPGGGGGTDVCIDGANNVYLSGIFRGPTDFDPGPTTYILPGSVNAQAFIQKLTPNGELIWVKPFPTLANNCGHELDKNGNVYVYGHFWGSGDFDPNIAVDSITSNGMTDFYMVKLDSAGNFKWVKSFGGSSREEYVDASINSNDDIFISFSSDGIGDFDNGPGIQNSTNNGSYDANILKLDTNGQFYWIKSYGGIGLEFLKNSCDKDYIYITGSYDDTVDFDPGPLTQISTSNGAWDVNVLKLNIDSCSDILLAYDSISDITCSDSGYVKVHAYNTQPPYSYLWNTTPPVSDSIVFFGPQSIYTCIVTDGNGCTRSFRVYINTQYIISTIDTVTICQGDSAYLGGDFQFDIGIYNDTLQTSLVCDSIFSSYLLVNPIYNYNQNLTICQGDSSLVYGVYQNTAGIYYDSLQTINGCDSIFSTELVVNSIYLSEDTTAICQGDSTIIFGVYQNTAGIYYDSLQTISSCDSILSTTLIVNSVVSSNKNDTVCDGDSLLIYGVYQNTNGVYYDSLQTISGCDSVLSTTLTINPVFFSIKNDTICDGDSLLIYGIYQSTVGIYYDSLQTIKGCDSVVSTTLIVNTVYLNNLNQFICQGDSIFLYGNYQNTSGVYYDSLQTINGCDSILSTTLAINILPNVVIASFSPDTLCDNGNAVTLPVGSPAGGNYSGTGVGGNNFDPVLAGIGTHNVIYTYTDGNSCVNNDTTIVTVKLCVGIDEIENDFGILIYPNPNTGLFTIEKPIGLHKEVQVKLLDASAKLILDKIIPVDKQKIKLDISKYSSGIYYLQLIVDEEVFIKQILKD